MMWLLCFFGGIGAMARYVLDVSIQRSWNRSFPLSTLGSTVSPRYVRALR